MALSKIVTKAFPTANHVGFHLKLEDDSAVVIDKDYMEQWVSGTSIQNEVKQSIGERMQADIDTYKALAARFNHADYETARSQIDTGLSL